MRKKKDNKKIKREKKDTKKQKEKKSKQARKKEKKKEEKVRARKERLSGRRDENAREYEIVNHHTTKRIELTTLMYWSVREAS